MPDDNSAIEKNVVETSDSLIDTLLDLNLPEKGETSTSDDVVTDLITEEPKIDFAKESSSSEKVDTSNSLITLEEAKKRISPDVLAVLSDKFNGKLTGTRNVDRNDVLF